MFKKVLIPLDRSSLAEEAIGHAASIARASHASIDLVLVHEPFPFAGYADLPWNSEESSAEQKYLETIADEIKCGAQVPSTHAVLRGAPAEMICQRAQDVGADLIVMTSHGRTGFSRSWLGSVADAVMRHVPIPVLILRPERATSHRSVPAKRIERLVVALDGSTVANEILPAAVDLAQATGASITLLRVVPVVPVVIPYDPALSVTYLPLVPDAEATKALSQEATVQLEEVARRLRAESSVPIEIDVIVSEHTAKAIVDFAEARNMDVIAMSTHGRGASRLLLGSIADKVLRASRIPILLEHPAGVQATPVALRATEVEQQLPSLALS